MKKPLLTYLLLAGFVASLVALIVVVYLRGYPFPGNQEGYEPKQPIAYSHKVHAGDLGISCLYCHYSAAKGPHAGIPSAGLCMNCHRLVTANWEVTDAERKNARQEGRAERRIISPELQKLYDALGLVDPSKYDPLGLNIDPLKPEPRKQTEPIHWVKVHNLPDYTRFDHRAHVSAGVICQECHGQVQTMNVVSQSASLSMGWCVRCHKDHKEIAGKKVSPSTDCATCHY